MPIAQDPTSGDTTDDETNAADEPDHEPAGPADGEPARALAEPTR